MKTSFIYIYAIVFLLSMNGLKAQEMKPDLYWDFNSTPLEKPVWGESILHGKSLTSKSENGIFGNYLHFNEKNAEAISAAVHFSEAVTIECWLRFSSENFRPNTRLFWFQDNRIAINFINELLVFNSSVIGSNGERVKDFFSIELNHTGRSSLGYYLDNQWHHFVFKYDGIKGRKEVWVDGVLPEGFSNQSDQRGRICEDGGCDRGLMFSHSNDGLRNFMGDLDELMIYSSMIPEKLHIKHYQEGKQKASKPSFSDYKNVVKPAESISSLEIDPREYPPQHPQVRMSQMEQLTRFPKPRFKPSHQLRPLFNWMELPYLSGANLPGATRVEVVKTSVELQKELAQNWNYMLVIQNANQAQHDDQLYEKNNYVKTWIDLANQHPEFPLGISTIWVQVNPRAIGINQGRPEVLNRSLNSGYYLKDRSGRFIDQNGRPSNRPHISFAAPDEFCYRDGLVQKHNISRILGQLSRPVYMISENGEAEPLPASEKVITTDPAIAADMKKRGITDWEVYQAQQKTRFRKTYLSAYDGLKGLDKTIFSWYAVDRGPLI
ncbi:MAG: hypothetical protein KDD63_00595, partial [Bacteroidetes bacterium]|nr:hypothetical protein [Bacteroidota bacterium]